MRPIKEILNIIGDKNGDSTPNDYWLEDNPNKLPIAKSGIQALDTVFRGFVLGELYGIGGRPGMGKTTLMLDMALNVAKSGIHVYIFSLDMSSTQLVKRLILKCGRSEIENLPISICDTALTMEEIQKMISNQIREGVGFLDYYQLIETDTRHEISGTPCCGCLKASLQNEASIALKRLARKFDLPIVVLFQLPRQLEKRVDKRPILSDISDEALLRNANAIMFINRNSYRFAGR